MQMDIANKYRVYFRKPLSIVPIKRRDGVCSKNFKTNKHILLWDFDDSFLGTIEEELKTLIIKYHLPKIYILKSSESHYHAYCFASRLFREVIHILSDTITLDSEYLRLGMVRGYYTLRFSPKGDNHIELVKTITSKFPEEMSPLDVSINTYYTTNTRGE